MGCDRDSLSILFTDDPVIRELNRRWLRRDRPTDVISWAAGEPGFLGDIAISLDTAARQATALGHSLEDEVARLLIHGILHLRGHDHVHGGKQAAAMRAEEDRLWRALGRADTTAPKKIRRSTATVARANR